jgi:hypothetical protein
MKTAMQRLITNLETMGITFPQGIQQTFLSIEKEQIEHAHAHHRCIHDKTMECTIEAYKSAEKYYNQTYKPETI